MTEPTAAVEVEDLGYDYHQDESDYDGYFDHDHSALDVDFDYEDADEA